MPKIVDHSECSYAPSTKPGRRRSDSHARPQPKTLEERPDTFERSEKLRSQSFVHDSRFGRAPLAIPSARGMSPRQELASRLGDRSNTPAPIFPKEAGHFFRPNPPDARVMRECQRQTRDELVANTETLIRSGNLKEAEKIVWYALTIWRFERDDRLIELMLQLTNNDPIRLRALVNELQKMEVSFNESHFWLMLDGLAFSNSFYSVENVLRGMQRAGILPRQEGILRVLKMAFTGDKYLDVARLFDKLERIVRLDADQMNQALLWAANGTASFWALSRFLDEMYTRRLSLHEQTVGAHLQSAHADEAERVVEFWCPQLQRFRLNLAPQVLAPIAAQLLRAGQPELLWCLLVSMPDLPAIGADVLLVNSFEAAVRSNRHELTDKMLSWLARNPCHARLARECTALRAKILYPERYECSSSSKMASAHVQQVPFDREAARRQATARLQGLRTQEAEETAEVEAML